jgi:uncharacterized protein YndB with AHSA1/START domain
MNDSPFVIERTFNAPMKTVWSAITDKDQMKKWYFDLPEFKPEVGFEFTFIGGTECNSYVHLCKITEVIEGRKLTHSWKYDGYEGNSFVTFELFEEGSQTRVKLTHTGLETFPQNHKDFARESFAQGWTDIIGTHLKNYLENA